MGRREILTTRFGEMQDMINCLSIYEGSAEPKTHSASPRRITSLDDALRLR